MDKVGYRGAWGCVFLYLATVVASPAQTLTTLHSFNGSDGSQPYGPLIQASDGNLYGTTYAGGHSSIGTTFRISTSGAFLSLYSFGRTSRTAGYQPYGGLIQARNGSLYGTTYDGGVDDVGTVFQMSLSGAVTTLASFDNSPQGGQPYGTLIQATNGKLYGTTTQGGSSGAGTVFEVAPSGPIIDIDSFCYNCSQGAQPVGGLVQAGNGNLYGTTFTAGSDQCGTIFEATPDGVFTLLHAFAQTEGCKPRAAMIEGADGNLYGTASFGGANGVGSVFRITPQGSFTLLYSFCSQSNCSDGGYPFGALVRAGDGNFYGTTQSYGAFNRGTIFKLTSSGELTTLYTFCAQSGCPDGAYPSTGLVQASDGDFYGTTYEGGASNNGTVFRLSTAP